MSKTYKDVPRKFVDPEYRLRDYDRIPYIRICTDYYSGEEREYQSYFSLQKAGVYTKKKRNYLEPGYFWYKGPNWFHKEFVDIPRRAKNSVWERQVLKIDIEDLEDDTPPDYHPYARMWWT